LLAEVIANRQLEYFKLCDKEIASTQHGLVEAVTNLSYVLGRAVSTQWHATPWRRPPTRYNFHTPLDDDKDSSDGTRVHHKRYRTPSDDHIPLDKLNANMDTDVIETKEDYVASRLENQPLIPKMTTRPDGEDIANDDRPSVDITNYYVDKGEDLC
jgi:hypothetical protein